MWSSKEATRNEKKNAKPEMGYCPFEHWLSKTRRQGAHGARARGWALGAGRAGGSVRQAAQRGRTGARGAQRTSERTRRSHGRGARGARLGTRGTAGWARRQRAVHSVHSAYFLPGLTRYFS